MAQPTALVKEQDRERPVPPHPGESFCASRGSTGRLP